jgi:hypothetical protein
MRFYDFGKPIIREAVESDLEAQKAIHDLDVIGNTLDQLPPEKENIKKSVETKLKNMSAAISAFLAKANVSVQAEPKAQPTAPASPTAAPTTPKPNDPNATVESISEAVDETAIADTINTLKKQITAIEASNIDEEIKKNFIAPIREQLDILTKQVEELQTAKDAAVLKQTEAENFVKEVSKYLVTLGNKVQGYQEEKLEGLTSKEKAQAKKRAVNAAEFTKTLKQALFGKIVDIQEEADVTTQEIKQFLDACVKGKVINMLSVIEKDRGNIKEHVNPEYQKLFNVFVEQNIFSYSPGKTSGAIGPGEMALSMMGNPAEKAKKGDLKIGNVEVEIKASASTGGRLNSKSISKATAGWDPWKEGIAGILSSAPKTATMFSTDKKGNRIKVPLNKFNGDQFNITNGKAKLGNKYNWNIKGFQALNEEVLEPYSDFNKTFDLFHNTIRALVLNFDKIKNADKLIASAIEQTGTVDWMKMNKAYTKIAYESYHLADGITTIMFLRTDTLDYTIIKDGNDLVKKLGKTVVMGAGFNWNDDQQTPTPGYIASK